MDIFEIPVTCLMIMQALSVYPISIVEENEHLKLI